LPAKFGLLDLMFIGLESHCFTAGRGLGDTDRMLELLASVVPCQDKSFDNLLPSVLERLSLLSGCICILLAWDESRRALVQHLQKMRIPTMICVMTSDRTLSEQLSEQLTLEYSSDSLTTIRLLQLGQIQEGLMEL
jgi:hypothetical protein